ncbi:MAG: DUF6431 domain-containing protein [Nitrospiraceae bacterium]
MIIVTHLADSIDELLDGSETVSCVEATRPTNCPLCGEPARRPGAFRLGIVGHGIYLRQVLGIVEAGAGQCIVKVRRYLCRGCKRTISILPDVLHPRRWYAAGVILEALRLHLVEEKSERQIRRHFGVAVDSESWRSLRRWRWQLLLRLWRWLAAALGVKGPARTRREGRRRLVRLLAQADELERKGGAGFVVAPRLLLGTVHEQNRCWFSGHVWPGLVPQNLPP